MPDLEIKEKEIDQRQPNTQPNATNQRGAKSQKVKAGRGGGEAVMFTCLELSERDPVIEEIPGNEVNVATRQINLANALGVGDWERKNRPEDCSSIIDTGFSG